MENFFSENLPSPPLDLLLSMSDNTYTNEEEAELWDVNGFRRTHPHFHRSTFYYFSPSGLTWNGFRVDLTHKDTNTKFGPDGKTWADSYKEFETAEYNKVCEKYPEPAGSLTAKRRLEHYLAALKDADENQKRTFVSLSLRVAK